MPTTTSAFDLPANLHAKSAPALIDADERHFAAIAESLSTSIAELTARLDDNRKAAAGSGQRALDRDQEVHRLTARLRTLQRFGLDLCLGRLVMSGQSDPVYIGRLGLTDSAGRRLLLDWRSPAAEPFFAATHANPLGLSSRRRYRWTNGRVTDYWDEVFTEDGLDGHRASLDDQSAFIASLGGSRSPRMRDVLSTIQADQDAIIRAASHGALVVDGGPGTGKTVVALHRTAHLLYSDPRLGHHRGGVLFVGPHQQYLDYVADVLPSLGEEGVRTCTVRDLVPEAAARPEPNPYVARLKSTVDMMAAIEDAVRFYEQPPPKAMTVATDWFELPLSADDWADAFGKPEPGTAHNQARAEVWDELVAILVDKYDGDDVSPELLIKSAMENTALVTEFNRAWPVLEPTDVVADLWSVPAYLRLCAPWLDVEDIRLLRRDEPKAWTESDLPLLDAARRRVGDPGAAAHRRRVVAARSAHREAMNRVVDDLIATDDSEMLVMSMLRGADLQHALADESDVAATGRDKFAQFDGPFAHIVVDEAQELTDAEWQMLLARCPSRSFTVVGDRAQARNGFHESWDQRLQRVGLDNARVMPLSVNYRTPAEVMAEAAPVIRAALPDANVPTSIRSNGIPVRYLPTSELEQVIDDWLAANEDGIACVISVDGRSSVDSSRVRRLTPVSCKGLEFDLVVVVDPERFGRGVAGAVDRYVAMTRATQELVILSGG